jgi:hypothetical protein
VLLDAMRRRGVKRFIFSRACRHPQADRDLCRAAVWSESDPGYRDVAVIVSVRLAWSGRQARAVVCWGSDGEPESAEVLLSRPALQASGNV